MFKLKKINVFIFLVILVAFFIAIYQPFGLSPDYANYEYFFQQVRLDFSDELKYNRFEPGFMYATGALVNFFASDIWVYGSFVVIAITIKLVYLERFSYSRYFTYLTCALYMIKFFPLLELTQLRASLGISFLLAAFFYIQNNRKLLGAAVGVAAILFHYSSLMLLPFLFLPKLSRIKSIIVALSIFSILYLTSRYGIGLAGNYLLVFQEYESHGYGERAVNGFSPVFFPEFFLLAFALFYWQDLTDGMRRIVTIELIGFSIFYALIDYPVVAVRGREFFSVMWILFVVQGAVCVDKVKLAIYIFISASVSLAVYQYLFLDFFA